jgi:hypothetical protein
MENECFEEIFERIDRPRREVVHVSREFPRGLTGAQYANLGPQVRRRVSWSRMIRNFENDRRQQTHCVAQLGSAPVSGTRG